MNKERVTFDARIKKQMQIEDYLSYTEEDTLISNPNIYNGVFYRKMNIRNIRMQKITDSDVPIVDYTDLANDHFLNDWQTTILQNILKKKRLAYFKSIEEVSHNRNTHKFFGIFNRIFLYKKFGITRITQARQSIWHELISSISTLDFTLLITEEKISIDHRKQRSIIRKLKEIDKTINKSDYLIPIEYEDKIRKQCHEALR